MCHELPQFPTIDVLDHEFKKKLIFKDICIDCWKRDPNGRPDMSAVKGRTAGPGTFYIAILYMPFVAYFLPVETERFEWKELTSSAIPGCAHNLDEYSDDSLIQAGSPGNTTPDGISLPDSNLVIETSKIRKPKQASLGHRTDCFTYTEANTAQEPSGTREASFVPVYPNSHLINEDGVRDGSMTSGFPDGMENGLDGREYLIRMNVLNVGSA
ncbi:hypothetical protein A7U60_g4201 [Sanghuangporus baumii]|uniref:Uncharacterized protein n=1 Tax=Sanghuangporus baumii TaxID=108892 RepID=A0A9Q5HZ43_SANBA|nr:hypothetical protein A7U60_g4201 [Sanghuangporus baumii]